MFGTVIALATALQSAPLEVQPTGREQAEAAIPTMRERLDDSLNDYQSARFRHVYLAVDPSDPGAPFFCGEINAKNRFGAYIGWRPFAAIPADPPAMLLPDGAALEFAVNSFCGPSGTATQDRTRDYSDEFTAQ